VLLDDDFSSECISTTLAIPKQIGTKRNLTISGNIIY
jgi:hypothetical protein